MSKEEYKHLPEDVSVKIRCLNLDKSSLRELNNADILSPSEGQKAVEAKICLSCESDFSKDTLLEVFMTFKAQEKEASFLAKVSWFSKENSELGLVLLKLGMQKISLVVTQSKRGDWIKLKS